MSVKEEEIKNFQSSIKFTKHETPMLDELENAPHGLLLYLVLKHLEINIQSQELIK